MNTCNLSKAKSILGRLADQALTVGRDVQGDLAAGVYGVQMFTIRREQGRLAEVAPVFRRFLDEKGMTPRHFRRQFTT